MMQRGNSGAPACTGSAAPMAAAVRWLLVWLARRWSASPSGTPDPVPAPLAWWPAVLGARCAVACAPRPSARCARCDAPLSSASAVHAAAASGGAGTEVTRDYTARHQLEAVTHGGTAVANRTYDAAGKLTQTVLGNGLIETRDYVPGSYLVETIAVPGVTEFGYGYDANGRKLTESQTATLLSQVQTFGYDAQDRLTSWSQDAGVVPAQTQSWHLTLVGDWQSTTRDGVLEARQHTDVHEVTRIKVGTGPNRRLLYDAKGNLTKDDAKRRYTWDPENRLQTARTPKAVSPTGQNLRSEYTYDALGRRVAKTVNGRVTRFIHAGAQVIQEEDGQAVAPPAERASDGAVADLAEEPASGGILPASSDPLAPVLRVNFQPRTTVIPPGFLADKGKKFGARTNGLSYGWSANLQNPDRIQRFAASLEEWDTFLRAARPGRPARSWRIALPNGTYPVIVVAGDAVSRNHTNHLIIGGIPVSDPDPATMDTGYELGDFDGYAVQATVTDGVLTIAPGVGAFDPTVCFIEIGPEGTTITPDVEARLADLVESMTSATYAPQAPSLARRQYVYGTYVDELLSYTVGNTRYFTHANSLYSVAAETDGTGAVVERYTYDAYGKRTVTNAAGTVELAASGVSQSRGFTGYIADNETGLLFAQARMYSPMLGRFIERDPNMTLPWSEMNKQYKYRLGGRWQMVGWMPVSLDGYQDGMSLYAAHFVPNETDPTGMSPCMGADGNSLAGWDCCLNKCLIWWSTSTVGAWCSIPGLISTIPASPAKAPYLTTGLFKKVMVRAAICCVGWLAGILIGCEARCLGTNAAYDGLVP